MARPRCAIDAHSTIFDGKGEVMRLMRNRSILIILSSLLVSTGARAECAQWDVSRISFMQSGHTSVSLSLSRNGNEISGTAVQYFVAKGGPFTGGDPVQGRGDVHNGVLRGGSLEFDVDWGSDSKYERAPTRGVYKLKIDEFGRLSGTTYDFNKPSYRAQISGFEQLSCEFQAATPASDKPVHRLGKKISPQQTEERTRLNVVRASEVSAAGRCASGLVWREAGPDDHVCVSPTARSRVAAENAAASSHRAENGGAYGPDSCRSGFVWREAFANDRVCVVPAARRRAQDENRALQ